MNNIDWVVWLVYTGGAHVDFAPWWCLIDGVCIGGWSALIGSCGADASGCWCRWSEDARDAEMGLSLFPLCQDLDRTVAVLLSKTGDQSNQFMREEAEKALVAMVENVTAQKAVSSLITGGARWALPPGLQSNLMSYVYPFP